MIYLDASVVVALLNREDRSPLALDWFAQCRDSLNSSDWLITETHSALSIKQRQHGLRIQARQVPGNSSSSCSRAALNYARSTAAAFVKLPSCSRIRFWACGGWHWTGPQFRHPRALKTGTGRQEQSPRDNRGARRQTVLSSVASSPPVFLSAAAAPHARPTSCLPPLN